MPSLSILYQQKLPVYAADASMGMCGRVDRKHGEKVPSKTFLMRLKTFVAITDERRPAVVRVVLLVHL